MDRKKIKEQAKKKIQGKLWELWKPLLIILAINLLFSSIAVYVFKIEANTTNSSIANCLISFIVMPLTIGYTLYTLNFVRGKKFEINDLFSQIKNILPIWAVGIIVSMSVGVGSIFLLIPGIVFGLMFAMTNYILADGELSISKVLSKSVEMMKGYKWDYFVFCMSFIGWILLGAITLGIAYIYVVPYMNISMCLYYEKLKK